MNKLGRFQVGRNCCPYATPYPYPYPYPYPLPFPYSGPLSPCSPQWPCPACSPLTFKQEFQVVVDVSSSLCNWGGIFLDICDYYKGTFILQFGDVLCSCKYGDTNSCIWEYTDPSIVINGGNYTLNVALECLCSIQRVNSAFTFSAEVSPYSLCGIQWVSTNALSIIDPTTNLFDSSKIPLLTWAPTPGETCNSATPPVFSNV